VKAELGTTLTSWSQHHFVAIGNPERHMRKASHRGSKQHRDHASQSLLLLLARLTYIMVLFFAHIPFVVNHTINATPPERLQQYYILSFQMTKTFGDNCDINIVQETSCEPLNPDV